MKLDKDYLEDFLKKDIIPSVAWSNKYYNNELCYVLKNEIYCKVFWIDLWYHNLHEKFKKQNMITNIENQDLTLPVIISPNLQLINAPPIIQNVNYYSGERITKTPFLINISLTTMLVICFIAFAIIILATVVFGRNNMYTMFV